jgi:serine/threonine protein kinase
MFATELSVGDTLRGKYRIDRILGRGGFGCAYLAEDTSLMRTCVIKELRTEHLHVEEIRQRFVNEARTLAQLADPRIVVVYELVEPDRQSPLGAYYIIMEYMAGGSLDDWVRRHTIEIADAVRMAEDVCLGLEQAHKRNIVHRDIKPGNILLSEDGRVVKVADWGLAHLPDADLTLGGQPGTLRYMAVEQALGSRKVDGRCDIYSVGAMLFFLVTGQYYLDFTAIENDAGREFRRRHGLGPIETPPLPLQLEMQRAIQLADCEAIIHQPVRRPREIKPGIPQAVEGVILKALAKKPADRYQSAGQMAAALHAAPRPEDGSVTVRPDERVAILVDQARKELSQDLSPARALRTLEEARRADPRQAVIYCLMANCYHLMQRPDDALKVLEEGRRYAPDAPCLQHDLGVAYMHLDRKQDAIAALERSLELDPSQSDITHILRRLRRKKQK